MKYETADKKYTFEVPEGDYRVHVARYSEPDWLVIEKGHKAISTLLHEAEEYRDAMGRLAAALNMTAAQARGMDARITELEAEVRSQTTRADAYESELLAIRRMDRKFGEDVL